MVEAFAWVLLLVSAVTAPLVAYRLGQEAGRDEERRRLTYYWRSRNSA